jgi:hypothetical protein
MLHARFIAWSPARPHPQGAVKTFFLRLGGVFVFFWRGWLHLLVSTTTNLSVIHYLEIPNDGVQVAFELLRDDVIVIDRTTSVGQLVLLTLEDDDVVALAGSVIPVARAYDQQPWERSGGGHAATLNDWECTNRTCRTYMPNGKRFVLRSRTVPNATTVAQIARFLEAASFGPTRATLAAAATTAASGDGDGLAFHHAYLHEQMDVVMPTYHREFFRRRVNVEWRRSSAEFSTRTNPCSVDDGTVVPTTWRRTAFSTRDVDAKNIYFGLVGNNTTRWQISVDNQIRSMPLAVRVQNATDHGDRVIVARETYEMCATLDDLRRFTVKLLVQGRCVPIEFDDTIISFPDNAFATTSTVIVVPLPALGDTTGGSSINWLPTVAAPTLRFVLNSPIAAATCPAALQANNDVNDTLIYGRTQDGVWLLYEPTIQLVENALSPPPGVADAGVASWRAQRTGYCANVPRSVFNEDSCVVSTNACTVAAAGSDDDAEDAAKNYTAATQRTEYVVCGSPGEVANDPIYGDHWFNVSIHIDDPHRELDRQRETVWSTLAVTAPDQLRQRVAWALFQMFALPKSALENEHRQTESFLQYYDIFVRHAFGNFRNVLREITYSPLMAMSLSYVDSTSVAYAFERSGNLIFPDENFARELMQLFTIGTSRCVPNVNVEPRETASSPTVLCFLFLFLFWQVYMNSRTMVRLCWMKRSNPFAHTTVLISSRLPKFGRASSCNNAEPTLKLSRATLLIPWY